MAYKIITVYGFRYLLDLDADIIEGIYYATQDKGPDSCYNITNDKKGIKPFSVYVVIASDNPYLDMPYIKWGIKNDLINKALIHLGHEINADEIRYYRSDKEHGNALRQLSDAIERAMDEYIMAVPTGYSYEDLRYHCTRFAQLCRLKGPKINHETVDLFDSEYAPLLTQDQYVNIKTRTVLSAGWIPTYNNPDNHNLEPSAEPINIPVIDVDKNGKSYITVKLIKV